MRFFLRCSRAPAREHLCYGFLHWANSLSDFVPSYSSNMNAANNNFVEKNTSA